MADSAIEITLAYGCGCSDTWQVQQLGDQPAVLNIDVPCVPDHCGTCQTHGICMIRSYMPRTYTPINFTDVGSARKRRYTRMAQRSGAA